MWSQGIFLHVAEVMGVPQEEMSASLWLGTAQAAKWLRTMLSRRQAVSSSW